jgi:hypothetical protein
MLRRNTALILILVAAVGVRAAYLTVRQGASDTVTTAGELARLRAREIDRPPERELVAQTR